MRPLVASLSLIVCCDRGVARGHSRQPHRRTHSKTEPSPTRSAALGFSARWVSSTLSEMRRPDVSRLRTAAPEGSSADQCRRHGVNQPHGGAPRRHGVPRGVRPRRDGQRAHGGRGVGRVGHLAVRRVMMTRPLGTSCGFKLAMGFCELGQGGPLALREGRFRGEYVSPSRLIGGSGLSSSLAASLARLIVGRQPSP
jgi:hypothetical protein